MSNGAAIDMRWVFADPTARPFFRNQRVDLLAPDTKVQSTGRFIVYSSQTEKGSIEIVRNIIPYAMARTDVGTPNESVKMLKPEDANGFFAFSPLVNNQTPITLQIDFNAPRAAGGALLNADRQKRSGFSMLSGDPAWAATQYNPLFSIPVPSEVLMQVTFELLPPATANGIPNPYAIGAAATKRVDFAGVIVTGIKMPQTRYDELLKHEQQREQTR